MSLFPGFCHHMDQKLQYTSMTVHPMTKLNLHLAQVLCNVLTYKVCWMNCNLRIFLSPHLILSTATESTSWSQRNNSVFFRNNYFLSWLKMTLLTIITHSAITSWTLSFYCLGHKSEVAPVVINLLNKGNKVLFWLCHSGFVHNTYTQSPQCLIWSEYDLNVSTSGSCQHLWLWMTCDD